MVDGGLVGFGSGRTEHGRDPADAPWSVRLRRGSTAAVRSGFIVAGLGVAVNGAPPAAGGIATFRSCNPQRLDTIANPPSHECVGSCEKIHQSFRENKESETRPS